MIIKNFAESGISREKKLARELQAAKRDDKEGTKFYDNFRRGLEEGHITGKDFSIRRLYEEVVDDGAAIINRYMNPNTVEGESVNLTKLLQENVTTGDFTNISGQIIYNEILEKWNRIEDITNQLCRTVPTQFSGEKIAGITNIGQSGLASPVAEAAAYPTAGPAEEYIETPATDKRGFIVPVTKEAIFFDRTGVLLDRCSDVGAELALNKLKRVMDVVVGTTNNYKYGGTDLNTYYATTAGANDWINELAANPLQDETSIDAARVLLNQIPDPNGEISPQNANTLLVPDGLWLTARNIVDPTGLMTLTQSDALRTMSGGQFARQYGLLSSPQVAVATTNQTTWFMGDFTAAFRYMENWPITVTNSMQDSEVAFTNDIVARYKCSERGVAIVFNPRRAVRNLAT